MLRDISFYLAISLFTALIFKFAAYQNVHPVAFMCFSMLFAALILLNFTKPGSLTIETIKSLGTWAYGILYFVVNAICISLLTYTDFYLVYLMFAVSGVLSFYLIWAFARSQSYSWKHIVCHALMLLGAGLIFLTLQGENFAVAAFLMVLVCITFSLRTLSVEFHRANAHVKTFEEELRVTGLVLAITGMGIFTFVFPIALYQFLLGNVESSALFPSLVDFTQPKMLLWAGIFGALASSLTRYAEFMVIRKYRSEFFSSLQALTPIFLLIGEWGASLLDIMPMQAFGWYHTGALTCVVLASLMIVRLARQTQPTKPHNQEAALFAQSALDHTQGNRQEAAKLLGLTENGLSLALGELQHKRLPPQLAKRLQSHFVNNISSKDSLTGLTNKAHFMALFRGALQRGDSGALIYLDLNKFKPINDTFGHTVGDAVLQETAKRLQENIDRNSVIARLGGDEFAILLTNSAEGTEKTIMKRLKKFLEEPITLENIEKPLQISGSFGAAVFPKESDNVDALIELGDKRMYQEKQVR